MRKQTLPNQFAWELLQLQIQFEIRGFLPLARIQQIISLYAHAVEVFESKNDMDKYLYFKRKMEAFLKSPSVIETLQNSNQTESAGQLSPVVRKQKLKKTLQDKSQAVENFTLKEMVINSQKHQEKLQQIIMEQHQSQQNSLQDRLASRRKKLKFLGHSISTPEIWQKSPNSSVSTADIQQELSRCIKFAIDQQQQQV